MAVKPVRRIVTGHDASGKAIIVSDAPSPHLRASPTRPGVTYTNVWTIDAAPAPIDGTTDPVTMAINLEPPGFGNNLRIVEFEPEAKHKDAISKEGARNAFAAMGGAGHALTQQDNARHPWMHRTKTVDYGIVLSGEIYLMLDDSETLMQTGDICIQRGTNHAWSNRSDRNCVMAFILIDGDKFPS